MPRPVLQAMVLADHVYQDRLSGKFIISGTFGRIALRAAPVAQPPAAPQPPVAPPSFVQPPANVPQVAPPRPAAPSVAPPASLPPAAAPSQPEPATFQPPPSAPAASPVPAAPPPPSSPAPNVPQSIEAPAAQPPSHASPTTVAPANPPVPVQPPAPPAPLAPAAPPSFQPPSSPSPAPQPPAASPPPAPAPAAPRQAQQKNENYVSHSLDTAAAQISVSGSPYLYLALTSIHNKAALNIQFVNQSDGDTIFDALLEVTSSDPVSVSEFCVPMPQLPITRPGVYSIDLLYSGEILGSWRLVATTI